MISCQSDEISPYLVTLSNLHFESRFTLFLLPLFLFSIEFSFCLEFGDRSWCVDCISDAHGWLCLNEEEAEGILRAKLLLNATIDAISAAFTRQSFDAILLLLHLRLSTYWHRLLLLKLDKLTCRHLVVEVCMQRCKCTAPLQALCVIRWEKWLVDGATNLFV